MTQPDSQKERFTPGPWMLVGSIPEEGVDCFWIKAQPANGILRGFTTEIATVDGYQDDPERQANAHLIASAPLMYAELQATAGILAALLAHLEGVASKKVCADIKERLEAIDAICTRAQGAQS